eukprot:1419662-Amphidinium_carterae.1
MQGAPPQGQMPPNAGHDQQGNQQVQPAAMMQQGFVVANPGGGQMPMYPQMFQPGMMQHGRQGDGNGNQPAMQGQQMVFNQGVMPQQAQGGMPGPMGG